MDLLVGNIRNIKIYDNSMFHMEEILEKYNNYLKILLDLDPKKLKNFILLLKKKEILNNQEAELEESFLMELHMLTQKKDSIDITMGCFDDGVITMEDMKKIHRIVIKGSSDDLEKNYDYRKDNDKWVGVLGTNGKAKIDYMPPDYKELSELIGCTLDYFNEPDNCNFDNLFIKPLILHALIAYMQPFGNGNTRLARVLQHCKICKQTNALYNTNFTRPILYLSKNYLITRGQYRGLIKNIAVDKNNDAWNRWFVYNLNMIDEQLYFLNNKLDMFKSI